MRRGSTATRTGWRVKVGRRATSSVTLPDMLGRIAALAAGTAALLAIVLAPAAAADPGFAGGAVLGAACDTDGPTFGYTPDGSQVLACVYGGSPDGPGVWVETANWSGVQPVGGSCSGEGAAVSPDGRGMVCLGTTWQPGP